jgi:D-alanyl-D-alanine carboxypeptidase
LSIVKKEEVTAPETKQYKIAFLENRKVINTAKAITAFLSALNAKAEYLGMSNTEFPQPHTFYSSAYDLIKMGVHATGYNDLVKIWNTKSYSFLPKGVNPRLVSVETTVTGAALENYYHIFGGKTGTGASTQQTLLVLVNAPNGNMFVGAIAENATDRYAASKELFDIATECANNPEFTPPGEFTLTASNCAVALLPHGNPLSYAGYDIPLLYSIGKDDVKACASTAKVMTAMVTLDYIDNINEHFEIIEDDLVNTPEPYLQIGDIMTFKDALHLLLLPSSNNTARALARVVGSKILNIY